MFIKLSGMGKSKCKGFEKSQQNFQLSLGTSNQYIEEDEDELQENELVLEDY